MSIEALNSIASSWYTFYSTLINIPKFNSIIGVRVGCDMAFFIPLKNGLYLVPYFISFKKTSSLEENSRTSSIGTNAKDRIILQLNSND